MAGRSGFCLDLRLFRARGAREEPSTKFALVTTEKECSGRPRSPLARRMLIERSACCPILHISWYSPPTRPTSAWGTSREARATCPRGTPFAETGHANR